MKKITILHVIPRLEYGGAQRLVIDIVKQLDKQPNVTSILLALDKPNAGYNSLEATKDITYFELNYYHIKDKKERKNYLFSKIESINPTIIHTHLFEAEYIIRQKLYKEVIYITHCHDNMWQFNINTSTYKHSFKHKLLAIYERNKLINLYNKCKNYFIYISEDTQKFYQHNLSKKLSCNSVILHNSINFSKFYNPIKKEIQKLKITLINVGLLVNKKNQQFLVDVINELKEQGVDCKLNILGDGSCKEMLKNKISSFKLENEITLLGNIPNVETYLKQADIYLHSATYEPFGLVLLEAMAAGLPVVTLDGKGNRDIIKEGENGFMIFEQNPKLFADKIIHLINNPDEYSAISEYAKTFAKRYDIDSYVDNLLAIYAKVVNPS